MTILNRPTQSVNDAATATVTADEALPSRSPGITSRVMALGMAVILLNSLALFLILSNYLRKDLTTLTATQLVTIANYVARGVDQDIVDRRDMLEHVAKQFQLPLLHEPARLQAWLGERHEVNPLFSRGLLVVDRAGVVLADYPSVPERVGMSFADRDYFQQAIQGGFAIGRPVFGRASRDAVLPMGTPLRDGAGAVQAILVGVSALQSANFIKDFYSTRVGASGGLVLVSPRDRLFIGSSTDLAITLQPTPPAGVHQQHDRAMQGFRGVGIDINSLGVEELAAIASVPSSGWFVVARIMTSELFAPIARLRNFILIATAILVPIFLLIMGLGLRYQLRPLRHAAQHAERMTRGEIPLAPLPLIRRDEVGHLTAAFNGVLARLLASRAELEHSANHDGLTGLPNRQLLADRMQQALGRARRGEQQVALLFLDLDGFKTINDRWGHIAGDAALCEVAARLGSVLRCEDTLARVGGDEFVILLTDLGERADSLVEAVAKKCLGVFESPFFISGQWCRLGTSIGIAIGRGECAVEELLCVADAAMYRAKEAGRGCFFWAGE